MVAALEQPRVCHNIVPVAYFSFYVSLLTNLRHCFCFLCLFLFCFPALLLLLMMLFFFCFVFFQISHFCLKPIADNVQISLDFWHLILRFRNQKGLACVNYVIMEIIKFSNFPFCCQAEQWVKLCSATRIKNISKIIGRCLWLLFVIWMIVRAYQLLELILTKL